MSDFKKSNRFWTDVGVLAMMAAISLVTYVTYRPVVESPSQESLEEAPESSSGEASRDPSDYASMEAPRKFRGGSSADVSDDAAPVVREADKFSQSIADIQTEVSRVKDSRDFLNCKKLLIKSWGILESMACDYGVCLNEQKR